MSMTLPTNFAVVWYWVAIMVGSIGLFALLAWAGGWVLLKTMEYLRVWNVLALCVAVRMHGKDYRDELFWRAIRERAEHSDFAADNIIQFVQKYRPNDGSGI